MTPEESLINDAEFTPKFLSREEEALFAEAHLGIEARDFLNSDLGRVLRGYALQKIAECKDDLLKTPAWRKRKIQQLQNEAAVADQFLSFIREALLRGSLAEQNLQQLRQYHD